MDDLEWFPNFTAVTGIDWEPPEGIQIEPSWTVAQPIIERWGG